jgi:Ca-activated chloride channel family protein
VPATRASSTAAARVWARARLRDLEDRYIVADHDREGLEKQLVATSIQFSVLCRFTAFVAVDRSEVVNEGGSQHRIIQPVSYPQGWEMPIAGAARLMACKSISVPYLAPEQVDAATAGPASAVQGKYELLEQVGHGARGAVYQARDTELNRIVTLKIVGGQVSVEPDVAPPPEQPRTPGAAARPVQRQQTGKLSRMVSRLLGRSDDAAASAASDLAAYRRRAAELLEQLQQSSGGDAIAKLTALGILAERLASLVEDLQSVGAPAAEINPLRHLLQMLRDGLAESQPSEAEVTRRWSDAARLLGAFAESLPAGATAADSRRQERFWK